MAYRVRDKSSPYSTYALAEFTGNKTTEQPTKIFAREGCRDTDFWSQGKTKEAETPSPIIAPSSTSIERHRPYSMETHRTLKWNELPVRLNIGLFI
jgi:hypothetical protein